LALARCVIVRFSYIAQGAANRLAGSLEALGGAAFNASLPQHAQVIPSRWLDAAYVEAQKAKGRSSNLRVPDVQLQGGVSPLVVPIQPGSLETRLTLLQPGYVPVPRVTVTPTE